MSEYEEDMAEDEVDPKSAEDREWLDMATSAFEDSTEWLDSNLRRQMERNYALFRSKHPPGSKYHSDQYKHRTKGFRPKTRSAVRKNEAAAAAAFFNTNKAAAVSAHNDKDEAQVASAAINQALVDYRLEETIPWFLLCLGAFQETEVNGATVGALEWVYEEKSHITEEPVLDEFGQSVLDEKGNELVDTVTRVEVIKDEPEIRIIPLENFRIDPGADWTDPINSSPYTIELMPMYIGDVLDKMEIDDPKTGEPPWRKFSKAELLSAKNYEFDTTRMAREGGRQDPKQDRDRAFATVWVHKVIIRKKGKDWLFYALGSEFLLSEPKRLNDVYLHHMRPYVMGSCILEAFRTYPSGLVELGQDLQTSANDLSNQRRDNVNLAMNKRYHIKRGKNVDLNALMRNVPGGGVMMDEVDAVDVVHTPDVTSSSYQEQDRLNVDFDELTGQFSQSSVQSNRSMNETVGGMELMTAGSNQMTEYLLKIFAVTWAEPVVKQLVAMEQAYETDTVILSLAADKAKLYQKFGIDEITDDLLRQRLTVKVDMGLDATDPIRRVEKLTYALNAIANALQLPGINKAELIGEILGSIGYSDSARFFSDLDEEQDPRISELEAKIQELMQTIAMDQHKIEAQGQVSMQVEQIKAESALAVEGARTESTGRELEGKFTADMKKLGMQLDGQIQVARENNAAVEDREFNKFDHEMEKLQDTIQSKLEELEIAHQNKIDELEIQDNQSQDAQTAERQHDKDKVVYLQRRKETVDDGLGEEETPWEASEEDTRGSVMDKLSELTEKFDKLSEEDSDEDVIEQLKILQAAIEDLREAQAEDPVMRKKTINYDKEGDPVSVTVEGGGIIPVQTDAKGRVKSIGEEES